MRNQYKEMFDGFAPARGDEELLKAVLGRKAENKMAFSKRIIVPVIAAAVLGTTAIGASAAYQWNQAKAIEQTLDSSAEAIDYPTFDLYKLGGKELHDEIKCDGFTLKTVGISADEHSAYMFYDIIFDEGVDHSLGENEKWVADFYPHLETSWVMEYWGPALENRDSLPDPRMRGNGGTIYSEGNVFHMYTVFNLTGIKLPGKTLNYEMIGIQRYNTVTDKAVGDDLLNGGSVKLSVDVDFDTAKTMTVNPNKRVTLSNGDTGTVKFIELSPFTLNIETALDNYKPNLSEDPKVYNTNGKFDVYSAATDAKLASLRVKFKDGTVKDINAFGVYNGSSLAWEYPVDVDQIASVTIGDCEVEIN